MVRTAFVLSLLLVLGASSNAWAGTEVRVAHLSPDAGPVDVYVDGVKVLSGVEFPGISPYLTLASGTVSVEVTPAGSTDAVIAADLELEDGVSYTVGATGLVADDDLSAIVLEDNRNAVEGETQVRVIHTSPDAPAVDVVVRGGNPLFENLSFRESSDYAVVAAATYDLDVTLTGTATVALPLDGVTLEEGTNYDVFAIGLVDNETLTVTVAVTDQFAAEPAAVRVAHLSPDAPNVDVYVDGALVLENVPFTAVSGYLELDAATINVVVTPTGEPTVAVIDADVTLEAGVSYTIAATGLVGDDDLSPIVLVDDRETDPDNARVRFVHASPDAPAVQIDTAAGDPVVGSTEFRNAAGPLTLAPGSYDLQVLVAATGDLALDLPGVMLDAGVNITVFAIGLVGDGTLTALPVVDASGVFVRGDSDQSGELGIADAIRTLSYLFVDPTLPICRDAADFDDDGHVSITDAAAVLVYRFLLGEEPATPFPDAGTDPTPDGLDCGLVQTP